jgi:hypothetical protein
MAEKSQILRLEKYIDKEIEGYSYNVRTIKVILTEDFISVNVKNIIEILYEEAGWDVDILISEGKVPSIKFE